MRIATILSVLTLVMVANGSSAFGGWWHFGDDKASGQSERRHCLCPPPAPRGEVAMSLPGQIRVDTQSQADAEADAEAQAEEQKELADRVARLEANLTRLSLAVEKVTETQEQTLANLTRLSLAVEKLAAQNGNSK